MSEPDDFQGANREVADTAMRWVGHLLAGDFDQVWRLLDANARLALVQAHILVMREPPAIDERDRLAAELAAEAPTHPDWSHFREAIQFEILEAEQGIGDEVLHAGSRPRPLAPGLELVRLFPESQLQRNSDGNLYFPDGATALSYSFIMRETPAGWRVAGIGEGVFRPGWPPAMERLATPHD